MIQFLFLNGFLSKAVTCVLGTPENNWTVEYQLFGNCFIFFVPHKHVFWKDHWQTHERENIQSDTLLSGILYSNSSARLAIMNQKKS